MKIKATVLLVCALALAGCYSFTGASLPPHIRTVAVPLADDISGFGQSDVRQAVTDMLIRKFTNEGSLQVTNRTRSDALVEVTITNVIDENAGVRANEQLTTRRVTIVADVVYRDQKKQKDVWQRRFQQSADYPIEQNLAGLRNALQAAEEKICEEILLSVISNW